MLNVGLTGTRSEQPFGVESVRRASVQFVRVRLEDADSVGAEAPREKMPSTPNALNARRGKSGRRVQKPCARSDIESHQTGMDQETDVRRGWLKHAKCRHDRRPE